MVRLTTDLIQKCPCYMNPLNEREIDMRGHKIPEIENMGVLEDTFDSIDLSDNEITSLGNFPLMKRCSTLVLHNNKLEAVAGGLGHYLPALQALLMHNNHFKTLESLAPLRELPALQRLSLLENQVVRHPDYRLYLIALLPHLKHLDFKRVRPAEREEAKAKFGGAGGAAPAGAPPARGEMSDEQKAKIAELIKSAKTLEDIKRIEEMHLPAVH
eukprot:TRINITY_DN32514_c0_g1_i1.p1 TRINITY_DN32514_c0_g1~~TRINITY_DN32514_c0_g1_i1.p1  ORF type:complete len:238 (+),score=115.41 TRINITY_DN32514_c0_g1_i1:73-714(+)